LNAHDATHTQGVRLVNGAWHCAVCGQRIDVPLDARPRTVVIGASGKRTERALIYHGREVHRCPISPAGFS
jgi:hypothetical protein